MSGWYPTSGPRQVENGLKARSTRGAIGTSWWSRRFLAPLEASAIGGRLSRGKAYARKGQVLSLEITEGLVIAQVQGSRKKPYDVSIGFAPLDNDGWEDVEVALSEQALCCAKLLAGEVPPELETIFAEAECPLFPDDIHDLDVDCSCPDWGVPCKHLAAAFYLLAESFDTDPFEILRWRGREREDLLTRLRILRSGADDEAASEEPVSPLGSSSALLELDWTDVGAERFWQPPPPLPSRPPVLTADPDVLLRQLPEPSETLGGAALVEQLRRVTGAGD